MLEVPVTRRLAIEEIAAESNDCSLERRRRAVLPTLQRATSRHHLTLELGDVELRDHRRIDAITIVRERDPVRISKRLSKTMQRHVEAVAELRGRRFRPEREPHLLLGPSVGVHQQIHEQLARARGAPHGRVDRLVADEHLQRA